MFPKMTKAEIEAFAAKHGEPKGREYSCCGEMATDGETASIADEPPFVCRACCNKSGIVQQLRIADWTPPLKNHWYGKHWRVRHRLSTDTKQLIDLEAKRQWIVAASGKRSVRLECWGWQRGRLPDRDAFDAILLDSLVSCGLLTDDDETGLDGRMEVVLHKSKTRMTVITLEDVP